MDLPPEDDFNGRPHRENPSSRLGNARACASSAVSRVYSGAPPPGVPGLGHLKGVSTPAGALVGKPPAGVKGVKTVLDKTRTNGSLATSQATTETPDPHHRRPPAGAWEIHRVTARRPCRRARIGRAPRVRPVYANAGSATNPRGSFIRAKHGVRPQLCGVRLFTATARSAISTATPQQNRSRHYQRPPGACSRSTGRRNTGVKSLCWGFKLQGLTWSFV